MANNVVDSAKPNEIQEISLDRDVKKRIIIGVGLLKMEQISQDSMLS